jgi:hypothetical protein
VAPTPNAAGALGGAIISIAVPVLAAVIGGLATAFFSKPKKSKKPLVTFAVDEATAQIDQIGLALAEGKKATRIKVKSFVIENLGPGDVTDLIVEYKNLRLPAEKFHTENNPSAGLLESYYDVSFSPERSSLRYVFNRFPAGSRFESSVTFNDFWVIGDFQANSSQAKVMSPEEHAAGKSIEAERGRKRLVALYAATVVAFLFLLVLLLIRS